MWKIKGDAYVVERSQFRGKDRRREVSELELREGRQPLRFMLTENTLL